MSPRKLSDTDRVKILDLYRNSEETTSTLATLYGVSSSTISRFLKNNLSESEYEDLIQEKRLARTSNLTSSTTSKSQPQKKSKPKKSESEAKEKEKPQQTKNQTPKTPIEETYLEQVKSPSILKIKTTQEEEVLQQEENGLDTDQNSPLEIEDNLPATNQRYDDDLPKNSPPKIYLDEEKDFESINLIQEMFGEDIDDDDDFDEDDDLDDDWDEDDEFDDQEMAHTNLIKVLPLSEASFPHTCYLVIDRSAELITRPLKEFAELGNIPAEEVLQQTLPIFDNHRVAKRFSNRRGKVIKVPDGSILQKTSEHLSAKGITRLLMDGKIYSL